MVAAIEAQPRTLLHTSVDRAPPAQRSSWPSGSARCARSSSDPQVFFCNSGAEAVDGAVKLAREVTGRPGVVAFRRRLPRPHPRRRLAHRRPRRKYREGYEPLLGGVTVAPYAYPLRYGGDASVATDAALDAPRRAPGAPVAASTSAAMIVEPVLGEGGYVVPPVEWLQGLRERCDRHGILLVFDEVQCGIGRTGRPFAAETFGVTPDVVLFAKGDRVRAARSAASSPSARVLRALAVGTHGSTFGGNPVSCAAALATLDVLDRRGPATSACRTAGACARGPS